MRYSNHPNPKFEGFGRYFIADHSVSLLIFSNLIIIFFAIFENWNLITIMFIYWCQSIIIGIFNFLKIINLKDFTTNGLSIGNSPAKPTMSTKYFIAFFFLIHYSMFHFGYFIFLISGGFTSHGLQFNPENYTIFIALIVFFANHLFSFLYNRKKNSEKKQNIGKIMFFPYIRIVPMHLTIIFGSMFIAIGFPLISIIIFLLLKTAADVVMHSIEHRQSSAEKITISLNKKDYFPGEEIRVHINLDFERPLKARSFIVSFIVEKIIITPSSNASNHQNYKIYQSDKKLGGEKEYTYENHDVSFEIPNDVFVKIQKWFDESQYAKAIAFVDSLGLGKLANYQEKNRFYIIAKLDVPLGLDVSESIDANITYQTYHD